MIRAYFRGRWVHRPRLRVPAAATLLTVFLLVAGCGGVTAANAQEETEWRGSQGGKEAFSVVVARTAFAWRALWEGNGRTPPAEFDASRTIAAALFLGQRRTGGFGITIESIRRRGAFMVVRFEEIRPAPDAMVSQALTSPYLVRLIPKTEVPIAFERVGGDGGLIVPQSEARVLEDFIVLTEREAREADTTIQLLEDRLQSLRKELERLRADE